MRKFRLLLYLCTSNGIKCQITELLLYFERYSSTKSSDMPFIVFLLASVAQNAQMNRLGKLVCVGLSRECSNRTKRVALHWIPQRCSQQSGDWEQKLEKGISAWSLFYQHKQPLQEWLQIADNVMAEEDDDSANLIKKHKVQLH